VEETVRASLLEYVTLSESARAGAPPPVAGDDDRVEIVVHRRDGTAEARALPAEAARAVRAILDRLYAGGKVAVLGEDAELTPNEVAEIVGLSRPLVVRRMEAGDLPFRWVGSHRRSSLSDVLAFKAKLGKQQKAMDAMAADMDDLREEHGL
jgi:excisionase family DNA binding protein